MCAEMKKTCAIIVTHNPDLQVLRRSVGVLEPQVDHLYIIDNGSAEPISDTFRKPNISCVLLRQNTGIAAALNTGIKLARDAGYQYLLLLDHDSTPPPGMVTRLRDAYERLSDAGVLVSGLGPRHRDRRTAHISKFVSFNWFHFTTRDAKEGDPIVPADFLISSGSFYHVAVFERVGLFNEGFFIDHVDTEWFHRARSSGFHAFGVWDVVMDHALGERSIPIWFLRKRIQPIHRPHRLYYVIRNSLLMYRMAHSPLKWISGDAVRLIRLALVYALFVPNRSASIAHLGRGFIDGIRGVLGPYNYTKPT